MEVGASNALLSCTNPPIASSAVAYRVGEHATGQHGQQVGRSRGGRLAGGLALIVPDEGTYNEGPSVRAAAF
jgi:hypothetical protein